jgi:hypothetical protein
MGSVIGLESLTLPKDEEKKENNNETAKYSPFRQRATSPVLRQITKPFSILGNKRVNPSHKTEISLRPENTCGECHKKLKGKTVRLPESSIRYHWDCLKCKGCEYPFEKTSFFIDASKNVYHPEVSIFFLNISYKLTLVLKVCAC